MVLCSLPKQRLKLFFIKDFPVTVEPRLTTTSLLWPYSFKPNVKTIESFYYFDDPVNATTSLLRPGFYGPTVVALTGFHCISQLLETFRFEDENDYEYEIWMKDVLAYSPKVDSPSFASLYFRITRKVSTVILMEGGLALSHLQIDKASKILVITCIRQ